jgi:hypothetical protein
VWPDLREGDVFALPTETREYLRAAVNEISGFPVFTPADLAEDEPS